MVQIRSLYVGVFSAKISVGMRRNLFYNNFMEKFTNDEKGNSVLAKTNSTNRMWG